MNEYRGLSVDTKVKVIRCLTLAVDRPGLHENDGVYAYRHSDYAVSWGVNAGPNGFCVARGMVAFEDFEKLRSICRDHKKNYFGMADRDHKISDLLGSL